MLLPLAAASLLFHGITVTVNDPQSHGTVGDALLSLDEAIRIANGTLLPSALSVAEQGQITGTGATVEAIVIDAMLTPTITLQSPLTDFTGSALLTHHVMIMGMPTPAGLRPVLQGGVVPRVFTLRSHKCHLHELRIVGGQIGVDARMVTTGAPVSEMPMLMECELEAQTTAGVRLHGTSTDQSMLMVMDTTLRNMPLGFWLDDLTNSGGLVMLEGERVSMDGVTLGCRVVEGGAGGNMSMFMLFRSTFVNGQTLAEKRRLPGSAQQFMFRFVHTDAVCTSHVLDIEGNATGLTMIHHHHGDFVAGAGQKAFWVWPRTAEFDVHGSEMEFSGDVSIAANLATLRVWQQNNRYHNGTVTFDVDGALPNLLWNHYENCTIDVPATARSPVVVRNSELINTNVQSASFLAPVTLQTSFRLAGAMIGFVSEQQPAPTAFLGTTTVTPPDPQVGSNLQLATDLPPGIVLLWDIVECFPRPTTTAEPVRIYGDPATLVVLPFLFLAQSQVALPLPASPVLAGLEYYVQGITLPLPGMSHAPAYHLPRGQRIRLRL